MTRHDFMYVDCDIPEGQSLAEFRRSRNARVRSRNARMEFLAAVEVRDPVAIRRAEREYARALLGLGAA